MAVKQREAEDSRRQDQLKREQGFSCCFSGANKATVRKNPTRRYSAGFATESPRHRATASPRGDAGGLGTWRRWEEHTVEIRGDDGEVYALRPTGDRGFAVCPSPLEDGRGASLESPCQDSYALWAAAASDAKSSPPAAASLAREKALALLRAQRLGVAKGTLAAEGVEVANATNEAAEMAHGNEERDLLERTLLEVGTKRSEDAAPEVGTASCDPLATQAAGVARPHASLSTSNSTQYGVPLPAASATVEPAALAERIAKLPPFWQASLLRHLEAAEAESIASVASNATSPCSASAASSLGGRRGRHSVGSPAQVEEAVHTPPMF